MAAAVLPSILFGSRCMMKIAWLRNGAPSYHIPSTSNRMSVDTRNRMSVDSNSSTDEDDDDDEEDTNATDEGRRESRAPTLIPASSSAVRPFLDYPMNFFTDQGNVPDSKTELGKQALQFRWVYRSNRNANPDDHLCEQDPYRQEVMIAEMTAMKSSLYDFATEAYIRHAKDLAIEAKLTFPPGEQTIVMDRDLKTALHALKRSPENEVLVYNLFHHRIRTDKNWPAFIVDEWAKTQNITLLSYIPVYEKGKRNRRNKDVTRLGFGAICLEARKKVLQKYMRPMFKELGWMIATTDKGSRKGVVRKYTRREVAADGVSDGAISGKSVFYVVERAKDVSS